jgi:hypothetical protein
MMPSPLLSASLVLSHLLLLLPLTACTAFTPSHAGAATAGSTARVTFTTLFSTKERPDQNDNRAMSFLRSKGLVGGNKDYTNVLGIDEGPAGKAGGSAKLRKAKAAYQSCVVSGVIDDFSNEFPLTSFGSEWSGFSDRVMGGISTGSLEREIVQERPCNVLRGSVVPLTSKKNNNDGSGFIQMATELALDPAVSRLVDASEYDGIELDVLCKGDTDAETETFNVQ